MEREDNSAVRENLPREETFVFFNRRLTDHWSVSQSDSEWVLLLLGEKRSVSAGN